MTEQTEQKKSNIYKSPSGKYVLEVSSEPTKPGCWDYTLGEVSRVGWEKIASVKRNYSSFPHLFIEGHPNGHDYLVAGEDYQGQTVIELDTGRRRDFLPEDAKEGFGFCWVLYQFHAGQQMLIVDGCIWAAPYEFRFYDFSDPMEKGWPQIEFENDGYAFAEGKDPLINPDGTIVIYETRQEEDDDAEEDPPRLVVATKTWRREGLALKLVEEWIDPAEKVRREESAARQKAWDEAWILYKKTDPLYLLMKERLVSDKFDTDHVGIGQCYSGWCPTFTGEDGRICVRLANGRQVGDRKVTLDLEWGRNIAPIKLIVFFDGKKDEDHWFDRSLENMTKALDLAASLLNG